MKKKGNGLFTAAIVFTVILVLWVALSAKLVILNFQDPVDIYAPGYDFVENGTGGHIETEFYACYGNCAYETTTTTKNGRTTSSSTDYYYVVPVYDKDDNEYYACVKVNSKNSAPYKTLTSNTYDYFETGDTSYLETYVEFSGTVEELDDEIYGYMCEYFEGSGMFESDAELKKYVLPYVLTPMNFDASTSRIIIALVLLAATILFWALFFIKRSKNKAAQAEAQAQFEAQFPGQEYGQYVVINGVSYPKDSMAHINAYVNNHETVVAIKELRDMTGLELAQAKDVIDNWYKYYN